jgi:hypothetical protein
MFFLQNHGQPLQGCPQHPHLRTPQINLGVIYGERLRRWEQATTLFTQPPPVGGDTGQGLPCPYGAFGGFFGNIWDIFIAIINYQLSIINYQLLIINRVPRTLFLQGYLSSPNKQQRF